MYMAVYCHIPYKVWKLWIPSYERMIFELGLNESYSCSNLALHKSSTATFQITYLDTSCRTCSSQWRTCATSPYEQQVIWQLAYTMPSFNNKINVWSYWNCKNNNLLCSILFITTEWLLLVVVVTTVAVNGQVLVVDNWVLVGPGDLGLENMPVSLALS